MIAIIAILIGSTQGLVLTDQSFQRVTLIGKHIPTQDWKINFCSDSCIEKDEIAIVNLSENKWLQDRFQPGIWTFYTNNTMCSNECQKIPQFYYPHQYEFFSLNLIFVHIGLVILVVFFFLVFRDIKKYSQSEKSKAQ